MLSPMYMRTGSSCLDLTTPQVDYGQGVKEEQKDSIFLLRHLVLQSEKYRGPHSWRHMQVEAFKRSLCYSGGPAGASAYVCTHWAFWWGCSNLQQLFLGFQTLTGDQQSEGIWTLCRHFPFFVLGILVGVKSPASSTICPKICQRNNLSWFLHPLFVVGKAYKLPG